MVHIQSDNPGIETYLHDLERLVEEGGGALHSNLVIKSEEGNLAVETREEMKRGREIIRLTRDILLPEDQYNIHSNGSEFSVTYTDKCLLTDLQKKLLDVMIGLYNETDKARIFERDSVYLKLRQHKELLDLVKEGRSLPGHILKWEEQFEKGHEDDVLKGYVAEGFLKTRFLGYSDVVRTASVSILMPVVDFLNHHWQGSNFNVTKSMRRGDLTVDSAQPVEGNRECFAFYGAMDALDTLIRYDFPDVSSPVVRSSPLTLDFFDYGHIDVQSLTGGVAKTDLPKMLAPLRKVLPNLFDPTEEERQDGVVLRIGYLMIPTGLKSPRALVRALAYIFNYISNRDDLDFSQEDRVAWISDAEKRVLQCNNEYYERLHQGVCAAFDQDPSDPVLQSFKLMADAQMKKLAMYQPMTEKMVA